MRFRVEPPTGGGAVTYKLIEIGLVVLAVIPISILSRGDLCALPECGPVEVSLSMLWLFYGTFNALCLYLPISLVFYASTLKRRRTVGSALILAFASGGWAALCWVAMRALIAPGESLDVWRLANGLAGYPALSVLVVFGTSLCAGLIQVLSRRQGGPDISDPD